MIGPSALPCSFWAITFAPHRPSPSPRLLFLICASHLNKFHSAPHSAFTPRWYTASKRMFTPVWSLKNIDKFLFPSVEQDQKQAPTGQWSLHKLVGGGLVVGPGSQCAARLLWISSVSTVEHNLRLGRPSPIPPACYWSCLEESSSSSWNLEETTIGPARPPDLFIPNSKHVLSPIPPPSSIDLSDANQNSIT